MVNEYERALSALNYLDSGCYREEWIRRGMAAKSVGLNFEDFHSWSKNASNYKSEKDCKSVWKSFKESGKITAATLFHEALKGGWQDPGKSHSGQSFDNDGTNVRALDIWERCLPVSLSHEYIVRKQGETDGMRVYPASEPPLVICETNVAGYLVVPCFSDSKLQTLQFIPPNKGEKLNLPRAEFNDGYFTVGDITDIIYICEGIGQAWAIYQASGKAAVVSFGAGRLKRLTKVLSEKYPNMRLVLVPDRGKEALASKVASSFGAGLVVIPEDKPTNYDVNDYAQEVGYDELANFLADIKARNSSYMLLSGDDLLNAPPMPWIVRGVIPAEGLAALYGPSGSGKSFLILDMACSVAAGDAYWFGRRVTQSPVIYICLEGEAGMGKRIKAWCMYRNRDMPDALRFVRQPFDLRSDDVSDLARAVVAAGCAGGLVIIDTLNRAASGADENSSVDMGNIIAASKELQKILGGLVMLVHHTGKDATKGLRGHSSLYAALDSAIELIKSDARCEWSVAKSKDDVTGDTHPFKLEVVQLGFDAEGEAIASCVAVPGNDIDSARRRIIPPKSGNQRIIWDALNKLFFDATDFGQSGAPSGRPCIRLEDAIEKTRGSLVCDKKRQTERTQSAITGLVTRGLLRHQDGWIWLV